MDYIRGYISEVPNVTVSACDCEAIVKKGKIYRSHRSTALSEALPDKIKKKRWDNKKELLLKIEQEKKRLPAVAPQAAQKASNEGKKSAEDRPKAAKRPRKSAPAKKK